MTVSAIIPNYNSGKYLREAIESVLDQSTPVDELVVVDDGSTDGSGEIAASYDRVRVIRQPNAGVSAARNRALGEITGDLVIFHDADDRLLPNAVADGLAAIRERPEVGFVFGFSRPIDANGSLRPSAPATSRDEVGFADLLRGQALVPPSAALFRCDAVREVGGFRSEIFAEDYDLYLRIARRHPIHCHNQLVVEYRRHGENASEISSCRMFQGTLDALEAERDAVAGNAELLAALHEGRRHWAQVFGPGMARETLRLLRRRRLSEAGRALGMVLRHDPAALPREILALVRG